MLSRNFHHNHTFTKFTQAAFLNKYILFCSSHLVHNLFKKRLQEKHRLFTIDFYYIAMITKENSYL